jgi:hypothetical protein
MRTNFTTSGPGPRIRFLMLTALVGTGLVLGACGGEESGDTKKEKVAREGKLFEVGQLDYNVLFSRQLNKFDVEDSAYLVGKPAPPPGKTYLGVFLKVENARGESSTRIPDSFEIVDTDGKRFRNVDSKSIFALDTGSSLEPGESLPRSNSTAATGPIQGALLVYLVEDEVLELRPVDLEVKGDGKTVKVELDL